MPPARYRHDTGTITSVDYQQKLTDLPAWYRIKMRQGLFTTLPSTPRHRTHIFNEMPLSCSVIFRHELGLIVLLVLIQKNTF